MTGGHGYTETQGTEGTEGMDVTLRLPSGRVCNTQYAVHNSQSAIRDPQFDIYLVGVGGQGVLTIGELLAEAALRQGIPANYYESKGMAQRGGFVKAQLRLGREVVGPNIPERGAHLVISMELSESLKGVRFVKPGHDFLVFGHVWAPTAVMLGKAPYPTLGQVREQVEAAGARWRYVAADVLPTYQGLPVPANIFVLGATMALTGLPEVLSVDDVRETVREKWRRAAERNLYAFQMGYDAYAGG